ncbi:MAG: hypothetical protein ACXITV_02130 [Luteibaculaceae bacterium]
METKKFVQYVVEDYNLDLALETLPFVALSKQIATAIKITHTEEKAPESPKLEHC